MNFKDFFKQDRITSSLKWKELQCNSFFGIFSQALAAVLERSSNFVSRLK
jgi:hypothetical protein